MYTLLVLSINILNIGMYTLTEPCKYNGTTYNSGDSFPSTDGCNECHCDDGMVACTEIYCSSKLNYCLHACLDRSSCIKFN